MSVCPREAERADAGSTTAIVFGPGHKCLGSGQPFPRHIAISQMQMDVGGDFPAVHCQHGLEETCHSGSGFKMTDVALDRTDDQVVLPHSIDEDIPKGVDLNGVAESGTGP